MHVREEELMFESPKKEKKNHHEQPVPPLNQGWKTRDSDLTWMELMERLESQVF